MHITLHQVIIIFLFQFSLITLVSCARMGAPDGGWYDERPPRVVSATPADRGTNVTGKKIVINFNEFVKLDNATEKVVISPPQIEQPEIKSTGKKVMVNLIDTLKPNTTYTIDFSDAITDNNESNPMGNYTYSFSTGDQIDTLEVAGYVLTAENLEPVKGILVGLFAPGDTVMRRVSRTDSKGYFIIRGVAEGTYTVGALKDMDNDYRFSQRAEQMAFSHDPITPSVFLDHRQDTIWADQIHVKDITVVPYYHYTPDDVVLRAFDHKTTDRYFLKSERKEANNFTLFFTAPLDTPEVATLPKLRGLNFNSDDAFVVEPSQHGDTVTYWLRDTALVNQDTLRIEMQTLITDTLGVLQPQTDTLEILPKTPYAKRLKAQQENDEKWQKKVDKMKKKYDKEVEIRRGEGLTEADSAFWEDLPPLDTIPPVKLLKPKYKVDQTMDPDGTCYIEFPSPMKRIERDSIHLYVEQDSVWYRTKFTFEPVDSLKRTWRLFADWIPEAEYSLEIDTLAFEDIYGLSTAPFKTGLKVQSLTAYASLFVNISGIKDTCNVIVQLLDGSDKPYRSVVAEKGTAEFYYIKPGTYYLRAIVDSNNNGHWDTGDYYLDRQPEQVFYNHDAVECKAKWDLTRDWNLTALPLYKQKPDKLVKQKADKEKTIQHRNAQRAQQKGIDPSEIPAKFM